jgi:hypothetical protein
MFERNGIDLDRSTLADWIGKSAALLEPLADAIGRHVLKGQAIFADDTPIKMQAPGNGKCKTARIWTYVRDERPWLGPAPPAAWYQFTIDRKGAHPARHLADYQGWMHADGYAGFNDLYRSGGVCEVACLAHIRRKFTDVFQAEGSTIAEEAIRRIAGLIFDSFSAAFFFASVSPFFSSEDSDSGSGSSAAAITIGRAMERVRPRARLSRVCLRIMRLLDG